MCMRLKMLGFPLPLVSARLIRYPQLMASFLTSFWNSFLGAPEAPSGTTPRPPDSRPPTPPVHLVLKADRDSAMQAARSGGVLAVVGTSGKLKWAFLKCPCGCGEILPLNLMRSHWPHWRVTQRPDGAVSLHPSVDATSCGSHFFLRNGRVIWCD